VQWVYFPLHPDTPPEGRALADLFAGRDLGPVHARLRHLMEAEGLPYGTRTHTYNSRMAQELAKWADAKPGAEAIHGALYRAYFVDSRNIADIDVLVDIAQSAGLPAADARDVLLERRMKPAVDADWARARQYRITGVPTFVSNNYQVVGSQPYDVLAEFVTQAIHGGPEDAGR
jgi:predicted DsbA family dithiol-disulfide isomerase